MFEKIGATKAVQTLENTRQCTVVRVELNATIGRAGQVLIEKVLNPAAAATACLEPHREVSHVQHTVPDGNVSRTYTHTQPC